MSLLENDEPVTVIEPSQGWLPLDMRELLAYRGLLWAFIMRDIRIRYKQTVLGAAWAVIQPFFMMLIFTVFFGRLAGLSSEGVPYPIFSYSALLPWTFFAEGINRSTNSMISNASIMTKVYFPRMILPIAGVLSPLVDFAVAFTILIGLMLYFGFFPTVNVLCLPILILLSLLTSLGVGLWLSALNVQYRDFQHTVPFLIQLWMFSSPIVYSSNMVPESYRLIYSLNPMAGVVEGFRWALLGTTPPGFATVISALAVVVLLISGAYYFRRMERIFADVV